MAADFNTGVLTTRGLALLAKWQLGTGHPDNNSCGHRFRQLLQRRKYNR